MRYLRIAIISIFLMACALLAWTMYTISLKDTVAPQIHDSVGDLHLSVSDGAETLMQGLTASDDRDGDLTQNILVEKTSRFSSLGVCQVSYVVFDKSNNFCRYQREVTYDDYESPKLALDKPLMYHLGEQISIIDRIKLIDCLDGDISHKLKLESSNVPSDMSGVYEIEVRASNNYGDEIYAKIPLNIGIYSSDAPKIALKQYLAYTKVGENFDPISYVESIKDVENNQIPISQIKVSSQVDLTKAGGGQVCFEVTDKRGVTGIMYLTVIVEVAK